MVMETQLAASMALPHLPDDICGEILARLPVKSVLRFRAVCKAWRDITTRPHFLAAHARLQPSKVVLYTYLDSEPREGRPPFHDFDVALDVLPASGSGETTADKRWRRLIRYTRSANLSPTNPMLLDSCDGVLLFKKDAWRGTYVLCNPVTRQWAELPELGHGSYGNLSVREYAFYFHHKSGEYRLLCGYVTSAGVRTWCVLSTGAAEPRYVDTHAAAADDDDDEELVPDTPSPTTAVAFRDSMHWPPRRPRDKDLWSSSKKETATEMVAFDVESEKFHLVAGPPPTTTTGPVMKLFVMHGLLVAADFGAAAKHVDLWFLVDYGGAGRWERRHQVPTTTTPRSGICLWSTVAACDDQGNVMLGSHYGLVVYNVRTKRVVRTLRSVATPRSNNVLVSRYVFRESLVEHPDFKTSSSADDLPFIHFWC